MRKRKITILANKDFITNQLLESAKKNCLESALEIVMSVLVADTRCNYSTTLKSMGTGSFCRLDENAIIIGQDVPENLSALVDYGGWIVICWQYSFDYPEFESMEDFNEFARTLILYDLRYKLEHLCPSKYINFFQNNPPTLPHEAYESWVRAYVWDEYFCFDYEQWAQWRDGYMMCESSPFDTTYSEIDSVDPDLADILSAFS
ncbi:MAG: hypothetical protein FWF79_09780 [Defluviitaleaceae bacterium]|nr:hypothetical protein [Defluviitaleaceae bacterium]